MSSLMEYLEEFFAWLVDMLLWLPLQIWDILQGLAATVIEAIPVPAWLTSGDPFAAIPDSVAYFLPAFQIPEGLAIIVGAFVIRFTIRRLPLVG